MQSQHDTNNGPGAEHLRQERSEDDRFGADIEDNTNSFTMDHGDRSMMSIPDSSPPLSPQQPPLPPTTATHGHARPPTTNDYDSSGFLPLPPPPSSPPAIHVTCNDNSIHNDLRNDDESELDIPNQTVFEEREMHRKLMDVESSFLPEPSAINVGGPAAGADDTYLVGVNAQQESSQVDDEFEEHVPASSPTPQNAYRGAEPSRETGLEPSFLEEESRQVVDETPSVQGVESANTTSLETFSSPPTTAAASRTVSRVLSAAFTNSVASEERDNNEEQENTDESHAHSSMEEDVQATPRRSRPQQRNRSLSRSLSSLRQGDNADGDASDLSTSQLTPSERRRRRPKFLTSRQSSHRYSTSSINTDTTSSEATMGVDYALQSGGAVPSNNASKLHPDSKGKRELLRTTSFGSVASGVSGFSDENPLERRHFSGVSEPNLQTLDEEASSPQQRATSPSKHAGMDDDDIPMTPKAKAPDPALLTDSVIAQHVQDIQVPGTFARQYREKNLAMSPEKRHGPITPGFGRGRNMTLKEQSSTIDRLSKENFDLKMRIHFLNEALNKRSEEGVKEMISENVELKSDKLKLQKDNQSLRKKMREMEKQLRDQGEGDEGRSGKEGTGSGSEEDRELEEEEMMFLRERLETYEVEIERLRSESIARESEKRRLAELVKNLGDGRPTGSETGAREERDMWKDMLDAETAAREQAEEEVRRLHEFMRTGGDVASLSRSRSSRHGRMSSLASRSDFDRDGTRSTGRGTASSVTLVELELLKQENAELRREVSAQTSMLTSRNREKERLYQEIEELKLQRRYDGRSVAGDSIFDRSASRAQDRSASQASDGTRGSRDRMTEPEREVFEVKNDELRDQVSTLRLENQSFRGQIDEYASDLETLDRAYQEDMDRAEEELQNIQLERDQAVQIAEEREAELQDLKAEAQEEIDAIADDLDAKVDECQRLEAEIRNQQEDLRALQAEMRSASEGIIRLEEDAQSNLQKYKAVQQELEDATRELENMDKNLFDANGKVQRLTVQQESSQNEIAFLREEQDGDKIKIGDLESELKTAQLGFQSEKDKTRELDRRLAEERHQREVVDSKEKQEVQRIMNDLNREATAARDEIRKLKKNLSAREIEASTWKDRFTELDTSLRDALGDFSGTKSSLLTSIIKLQKELESTALELESTRTQLDEREALLRSRDALLESHALESRKLSDLLERERHAHRADKHSFEQALKSHQHASRTIVQNTSRISDLESARGQDRKRFSHLENQLKDQLNERNAMFLTIWKRVSAMCGPDWAHSNSLINGNLPSQEVISNMLFWPGFSRNLLLAVKTVEQLIGGFKGRIKTVERDLTKAYQNVEHTLGIRLKKLDRLEEMGHQLRMNRRPLSSNSTNAEMSKLRGENRLLKAELNLVQSHRSRHSPSTPGGQSRSERGTSHPPTRGSTGIPQPAPSQYSSSTTLNNPPSTNPTAPSISSQGTTAASTAVTQQPPPPQQQPPTNPQRSEEKWIQRLRELERRLKAEREARLLDRSGARKRLEERSVEIEELNAKLERARIAGPGAGAGAGAGAARPALGLDGADERSYQRQQRGQQQQQRARDSPHTPEPRNDGEESSSRYGSQHRQYSRSHVSHRDEREQSDSYDDEEDDDDGNGTGTDDGVGFCVEVEV